MLDGLKGTELAIDRAVCIDGISVSPFRLAPYDVLASVTPSPPIAFHKALAAFKVISCSKPYYDTRLANCYVFGLTFFRLLVGPDVWEREVMKGAFTESVGVFHLPPVSINVLDRSVNEAFELQGEFEKEVKALETKAVMSKRQSTALQVLTEQGVYSGSTSGQSAQLNLPDVGMRMVSTDLEISAYYYY
ncbi:hypothetical protein BD310DRAFT_805622 [Dichomitus squalens]|uniref:Uncharacterized protein n=1 Tax=Dichomitus squalens TaxID=114155 RepID=A0A4Q9QDI3_9APHY|nr:hypothetical protein BD310DRAFT_805622 [Dichomitus squalens]